MESRRRKSSVNQNVEEYLDYYCHLSSAPGFAILLKGQWGAGKTWFAKNYFQRLDPQSKKHIYISVYGASSLSDIDDRFFQSLHPILSSKPAKLAGIILKDMLKLSIPIYLNQDNQSDGSLGLKLPKLDIPQYLKDVDKRILVFDDIERCSIDIEDLFGYINSFVEEQGSKVVLLANEEKLLVKVDSYGRIKEKLVGKTFNIQFNLEDAIEAFMPSLKTREAEELLLNNVDLIKEIYTKAGYENLRSLKQIVLDFERIFLSLPKKAKGRPDLLSALLRSLVALSVEVYRGNLRSHEIKSLSEERAKLTAAQYIASKRSSNEVGIEDTKLLQPSFLDKYNLHFGNKLFPAEIWWGEFFEKGIIDVEELNTAVQSSTYFQEENTPDWQRLWHFMSLSDEEFVEILSQVSSKYENKRFSDLKVIKHVFGTLLTLSHVGLYSKPANRLLDESKEYIKQVVTNSWREPLIEEVVNHLNHYLVPPFSLEYHGKEYDEFKDFEEYTDRLKEGLKENRMSLVAEELLEVMISDVWKFNKLLCLNGYSDTRSYHDTPVLRYVDVDAFVSNILSIKNMDRHVVFHTLEERYKPSNHNLHAEIDWLLLVQEKIEQAAESKGSTLTGYCLENLNDTYLKHLTRRLQEESSKLEKTC